MHSLGLEAAKSAKSNVQFRRLSRDADAAQRYPKDLALLEALTVIAHDLRSPLSNLSLALELGDAYAKVRAYDRAAASTARAMAIIGTLDEMLSGFLRRTRETGDPLSFRNSRVNVAEVVMRAIELNEPMSASRSLTFDCAAVTPLTVSGDEALLIEAIENLVSNAARHAPCGSIISCSTAREEANVVIAITDTGGGLSAAQLQRASRPFMGASACKQGHEKSWGLGLWIVRLIVERHGGRVEVKPNAMSSGSTIRVLLPMRAG